MEVLFPDFFMFIVSYDPVYILLHCYTMMCLTISQLIDTSCFLFFVSTKKAVIILMYMNLSVFEIFIDIPAMRSLDQRAVGHFNHFFFVVA